jgi:hypothetical protein
VHSKLRQLYPRERHPVSTWQEAEWGSGLSGRGRQISPPPSGLRSPDRPGRSESLYRLSYCGRPLRLSALAESNLLTGRTNIVSVYSNRWHSGATSAVEFNPIKSINQIDFRLNTACGTTVHDDPQSLCVSPLSPYRGADTY